MHPQDFHRIPNLSSCQYLDDEMARLVDRWIGRVLTLIEYFSPSLRRKRRQAQQEMANELERYDEYLCSFAPQEFDDDVPF